MNLLQKLRQMVGEIEAAGANAKQDDWDLAHRLLGRMPTDNAEVDRVHAERDIAALDALVTALENPQPKASPAADVSQHDMDAAFRAFKKRLKLARLADESKLGGRQLSGGHKSEIDAIIPPREYPPEVWAALVRDGRLKNTGQGFYALP